MNKRSVKWILAALALVACLAVYGAYDAGKKRGLDEASARQDHLHELNRQSIENINVEEGETIYVIGHMSPDSDTVCSAIGYARLLKQLGYEAEAMVSGKLNRETIYILEQAGVEVPEELVDASGLNIFLVDHSEYAQSVPGMDDAHIVGILDHHGIGSVSTGHQVVYEAKPIGATATIVWLDYLNYGIELDRQTAHLLLGAVLSDTSYLMGTTVTEADRAAVKELAGIAEVSDVDAFFRQMHIEALSYEGMSDEEMLFSDYKEYEAYGVKYGIGMLNSIDEETSKKLAAMMKDALAKYADTKDVDLIYASVGIREGDSKIDYIIPGNELSESILKNAFPDYDEYDGTSYIFRSGLGRKTKFVPGLNDYLGAHPHE